MKKKTVLLCYDGFEEIEALTAVDVLRRAGIEINICSMTGSEMITGSHGIVVKADVLFENCGPLLADSNDAVILPGGLPNAFLLRDDERVITCIRSFADRNKLVCAICAAPCVLERAGLLNGRKATSYPDMVKDSSCGEYVTDEVAVDANFITSRGPGTALAFAFEIANALGYSSEIEKLKRGMIYRQ